MGICQSCGRPKSDCVCSPLVVSEIAALRKRMEELEISAGSAAMTIRLAQARAEKAERELQEERACHDCDEARSLYRSRAENLQADLDAALDWIEYDEESGQRPRIEALLEKRKEAKRG